MYDDFFSKGQQLAEGGEPFATATVVRADKPTSGKPGDKAIVTRDGVMIGWIGGSCAQPTVIREALEAIREDRGRLIRLTPGPADTSPRVGIKEVPMTCFSGGTLDIWIEPQQPRPRLLIVGNLPTAQALAHLGKAMSYRVIAIDLEADSEAMAHADVVLRSLDELIARVNPLTWVVVATHGQFDEQALVAALRSEAPYVGLVASPKRGRSVLEYLHGRSFTETQLARLKVPAGHDIGARRGDEIALSIMAEIVERRRAAEQLEWPADEAAESVSGSVPETGECCGGSRSA